MACRSVWQRDCLSDRRPGSLSDEEVRKFPTNLWYGQSGRSRFCQRVTKAKVFRLKHLDSAGEISAYLTHPKITTKWGVAEAKDLNCTVQCGQ